MSSAPLDERHDPGGGSITGKQILIGVLLLVAIVFAIINHESVATNFLFFTVETPHWIGLTINFALGLAAGWFLCSRRNSRRRAG
jgi:uncharacterized integral membrane protein